MSSFFALSIPAAASPTLCAAVGLMLLSKNAKRLMLGYLLGAYTTTIGLGLVIVFAIPGSGAASTTRTTISPALNVALGVLALVIALAVHRGPSERREEQKEKRKEAREQKGPPRWQRALDKGSSGAAFAVGVVLSLPGASYLVALDILHKQALSDAQTVVAVVAFCVIMLALIEIPVIAFAVAPDWTPQSVKRFQAWIHRDGRRIAFWVALSLGVLLILRGAIEALT
jgi:Sap-like sulfolipid-1-addressing protein